MTKIVLFAATALSSSEGVIGKLFIFLMILLAALVLWAMGNWLIPKFGAPPIVLTIWHGLFVLLGGILLINFFLGLAGKPLFDW